jgi:hypothetical protein
MQVRQEHTKVNQLSDAPLKGIQTFDYAIKACQGQTLWLTIRKLQMENVL